MGLLGAFHAVIEEIPLPVPHVGDFLGAGQVFPAFAEFLLDQLALGDVDHGALDGPAALPLHQLSQIFHPNFRSVLFQGGHLGAQRGRFFIQQLAFLAAQFLHLLGRHQDVDAGKRHQFAGGSITMDVGETLVDEKRLALVVNKNALDGVFHQGTEFFLPGVFINLFGQFEFGDVMGGAGEFYHPSLVVPHRISLGEHVVQRAVGIKNPVLELVRPFFLYRGGESLLQGGQVISMHEFLQIIGEFFEIPGSFHYIAPYLVHPFEILASNGIFPGTHQMNPWPGKEGFFPREALGFSRGSAWRGGKCGGCRSRRRVFSIVGAGTFHHRLPACAV